MGKSVMRLAINQQALVLAVLGGLVALLGASQWLCKRAHGMPHSCIRVSLTHLETINDRCMVSVRVRNCGHQDLTFSEAELPWCLVGDHMTVALVEEDHLLRRSIERTPATFGGVPGLRTIKAGQEVEERVDLSSYYGSLLSVLARCEVTLLWAYRPQPLGLESHETIVGVLSIPSTN